MTTPKSLNTPDILVLGATGTIGSQVARQLLDAGVAIRVGVRTPGKAAALGDAGAEVVRFDYDDPSTWRSTLAGIERAFVVAPFTEGFAEPVMRLFDPAKEAGVRHLVKLSAMGVSPDVPFALGRQHAKADDALQNSGIGHTILRPAFFMDNVFNFHGHTIQADGAFYGASAGQGSVYVSSRDVAAVAATVLRDPSAHDGQIYTLTGGEALTDAQVAEQVGESLGRDVRFVDLPLEQLQAGMEAQDGMPPWLIEALIALENVKAQGWATQVSPAVEDVLGRPPESFASWLARRGARVP